MKPASIVAGVAVVALVGWMAVKSLPGSTPAPASADAAAPVAIADAGDVAPAASAAGATGDVDAGLMLFGDLPTLPETFEAGTLFYADGTPIPIPGPTPRAVRFGVILVQYEGSEGASTTRSKKAALGMAMGLANDAKTDFHKAVKAGDEGSADDVGRLTRGDLEPAPEAALFSLAVGGVSGVIDTPRGFWIAKRLE